MTDREQYSPGPAGGAQIEKDGENWTLVLVLDGPTLVVDAGHGSGKPWVLGLGTNNEFPHLPMMVRTGSRCKVGSAMFRPGRNRGRHSRIVPLS